MKRSRRDFFFKWRISLIFTLLVLASPAQAQWKEEVIPLKAGWNSAYLHVDTSDRPLHAWVGNDPGNPIQEIWLWVPPRPGFDLIDDPQQPQQGRSEWRRWERSLGPSSPLVALPGNVSVLVRVANNVSEYNWVVRGRAMPPEQSWSSSGLNFIGFPVPSAVAPLWSDFLGGNRTLLNEAEIYRYVGGALAELTNPQRLFPILLRGTRMVRNHAYWVRAEDYNRYFGPFEIELENPSGLQFGSTLNQYAMRLRNATSNQVTVTVELLESLQPPSTNFAPVAGIVPLVMRGERDLSDLTYSYSRFTPAPPIEAPPTPPGDDEPGRDPVGEDIPDGFIQPMPPVGPVTIVLEPMGQPGSLADLVFGLDRAIMEGAPGTVYGGILRLWDHAGAIQYDLPVHAEISSPKGLWIGNAMVSGVQNQLARFERGPDGRPALDENGRYTLESMEDGLGDTRRMFPLRLVLHQSQAGNATLWQRIFFGPDRFDQTSVISRHEQRLAPDTLSRARRISVAHLPWTPDNQFWIFDGPLERGAAIMTEVVIPYDHKPSNPFLHIYHPDHDTMDARFENSLPRGVESFDIVRRITLTPQAPGRETFQEIVDAASILTGLYEEELILRGRGSSERAFYSYGGFALNQVADIDTVVEAIPE